MSPDREPIAPGCCALGDANLAWFRASPPRGAWHPASFRWDPRVDVPVSDPVERCPFCGRELRPPEAQGAARG